MRLHNGPLLDTHLYWHIEQKTYIGIHKYLYVEVEHGDVGIPEGESLSGGIDLFAIYMVYRITNTSGGWWWYDTRLKYGIRWIWYYVDRWWCEWYNHLCGIAITFMQCSMYLIYEFIDLLYNRFNIGLMFWFSQVARSNVSSEVGGS